MSKTPSSASKSYPTRTLTFKYYALYATDIILIMLCDRSSVGHTLKYDK